MAYQNPRTFQSNIFPGNVNNNDGYKQQNRPGQYQTNFPRVLFFQSVKKYISDEVAIIFDMKIYDHGMQLNRDKERTNQNRIPWIVITKRDQKFDRVVLPMSMCEQLIQHFMSCSDQQLVKKNTNAPGVEDTGDKTDETALDSNDLQIKEEKIFEFSKLTDLKIQDEEANHILEVTSSYPGENCDLDVDELNKQLTTKSKEFWLCTYPLHTPPTDIENPTPPKQFWNKKACLQLYEILLPDLLAFLSDAHLRYRTIELPSVEKALYSASGDRRYYFDVRNTRWGNRIHISQVTDLHRNVIGIPFESMIAFRDRLTHLIDVLDLENGKDVRDALGKFTTKPFYGKSYQRQRNFGGYNQPSRFVPNAQFEKKTFINSEKVTQQRVRQISLSKNNSNQTPKPNSQTSYTNTQNNQNNQNYSSSYPNNALTPVTQNDHRPTTSTNRNFSKPYQQLTIFKSKAPQQNRVQYKNQDKYNQNFQSQTPQYNNNKQEYVNRPTNAPLNTEPNQLINSEPDQESNSSQQPVVEEISKELTSVYKKKNKKNKRRINSNNEKHLNNSQPANTKDCDSTNITTS